MWIDVFACSNHISLKPTLKFKLVTAKVCKTGLVIFGWDGIESLLRGMKVRYELQ